MRLKRRPQQGRCSKNNKGRKGPRFKQKPLFRKRKRNRDMSSGRRPSLLEKRIHVLLRNRRNGRFILESVRGSTFDISETLDEFLWRGSGWNSESHGVSIFGVWDNLRRFLPDFGAFIPLNEGVPLRSQFC